MLVNFLCIERLVGYTGCTTDGKPKPDAVDVNMEALILLAMRMFDRSETSQNLKSVHSNCLEWHWTEFLLQVSAEFDTEELAQCHRAESEKEEERMRAHKVTCPKSRMLSHHAGKRRAMDDILAKSSAVMPGSPDKDTTPPAKHSCRKLMDDTDPDL